MHPDCRLVSNLMLSERRYCASSLWNEQVSGLIVGLISDSVFSWEDGCIDGRMVDLIVGLMSDSIFSCEDSCIDGRMVDNDFRRDCTNKLLLYMAVIPTALAMPLDPAEDGERTDSSTPLCLVANDMEGTECIDAEK